MKNIPNTPTFLILSVVKIKAGKKYVGKPTFYINVIEWMQDEFAHVRYINSIYYP